MSISSGGNTVKRGLLWLSTCCLLIVPGLTSGMSVIVYTAHQSWDSRIYILDLNGNVIEYFEYSFYRLMDLEIVDNEVYVAEAFAPRGLKFDLQTGDLEVIIDDWSLYYFYDLAWDQNYFYVTEWDLNRYDIDGHKDGTAGFSEDVLGSCYDGTYYWTLADDNLIKCWDLSGWPTVVAVPENNFTPPSPDCRGLWFDNRYFWTAEAKDTLGYIYQFGYDGQPVMQWLEPAFTGWSAALVHDYVSAVDDELPTDAPTFGLRGNHPNPFNPRTSIVFELPARMQARLTVHTVTGRRVTTLIDQELAAGDHRIVWDGKDDRGLPAASGTYFYRLSAGSRSQTQKMMLIR
jgi:hypothetical protein